MDNLFPKIFNMSFLEGLSACIELLIFATAFYFILRFLHGTRGLGIMKGILSIILVLIILLILTGQGGEGGSTGFYLPRLRFIAGYFLAVSVLALVMVFQPEIRRGLTRLGEVGLFGRGEIMDLSPIVQGVARMAHRKIGALLVIQRSTGLGAYTEGAVRLNSEISGPLLESIFFPNSPLHDGAVLIQRSRIVAACCLLPLSEKTDLPQGMGTRHRAALGISEESDALALVVSEETGKISIAYRGEIIVVKDAKELDNKVNDIVLESSQDGSAA